MTTEMEPLIGKIGENIDIPHGRTVQISDDIDVTFQDVDDGRCIYTEIVCVWYGNATVAFRVNGEDVSLNTFDSPNSPVEAVVGDYTITLLALAPYETDTWPIEKKQYVATIRVTAL